MPATPRKRCLSFSKKTISLSIVLIFSLFSTGCGGLTAYSLPDTGQIKSYTETRGEDSDYHINPPSYIDNGDGTITDSVTGLIWQKKDDNKARSWQEAQTYAKKLKLGEYSDWRVPTAKELMHIIDNDRHFQAIDKTYFPNTKPGYYWSSTTYEHNPKYAWRVNFIYGRLHNQKKSHDQYYVRCVRGKRLPKPDFVDNTDGTITDLATNLTWQQGESSLMSWEEALVYAEGLELAGHNDWRLPNKNELQSIVDYNKSHPAIDKTFFPEAKRSYYWSSTTTTNATGGAWYVNFYYGSIKHSSKSKNNRYVRCVRGEAMKSTTIPLPSPGYSKAN